MDDRLTSINDNVMSMTTVLQKIAMASGIEKLFEDALQIQSQGNEETKETLHEALKNKASQCEEYQIEDAVDDDLSGILKQKIKMMEI